MEVSENGPQLIIQNWLLSMGKPISNGLGYPYFRTPQILTTTPRQPFVSLVSSSKPRVQEQVSPKNGSFLPQKFLTIEFHSDTLFRIIASEKPPPFHRSFCALHMALGGRRLAVGYLKIGQKWPRVCRTHDANVKQLHGTNTHTTPDVYFLES
jgi:hypothetical protein